VIILWAVAVYTCLIACRETLRENKRRQRGLVRKHRREVAQRAEEDRQWKIGRKLEAEAKIADLQRFIDGLGV